MYFITLVSTLLLIDCVKSDEDYNKQRAKIIELESRLSIGGNITLSDKERIVNNCLMQHKFYEVDYAFDNPEYCNVSHHFFLYKDLIRKSKVFKIIKDMPKGAVLHVHDMGILGPDYVMNLTYMEHLYVCFGQITSFLFSKTIPKTSCDGNWKLISDARKESRNVTKFDSEIRQLFTLVVNDPDKIYPTIKETWDTFMNYFSHVIGLLTYRPIWEQYFYDVLKTIRDDNCMYVEIRSILPPLYELDGTVYNPIITAKAFKKVFKKFVKDYPDFVGAKLIFAPPRRVSTQTIDDYIRLAREIKKDMPEYFAGFDLVGQEDAGKPLIDFVPQLNEVHDLTFFFHAGETNWFGASTDENLIDAILLGAKRIGHAYALMKHPVLVREVLERDIGLEVNVLSNSVLSLVKDVRNHPLSTFLSLDLPVVLSSDDPGAWEADPLSHDFYVAFVGVASKLSDLRMLKALAINSLKYSALNHTEKNTAIGQFNTKWNQFIDNFDCSSYSDR